MLKTIFVVERLKQPLENLGSEEPSLKITDLNGDNILILSAVL